MANQSVGGLYATVKLDTSQALRELNKLDAKLKKVFTSTGMTRGSTGIDKLGQQATKTATRLTKTEQAAKRTSTATKKLGTDAEKAAKQTGKLGDAMKGVGDNLSTTLASFGAARSGNYFYALSSGVQAVTRGFGGAAAGAGGAGAAIAGLSVIVLAGVAAVGAYALSLKKLTDISIESGANLERLSVSFEALLGSSQRARKELEFLVEAAKISPYFTEDIVALDRFLLAQGLLNDELRQGVNKSLIDFGAAAGLTGDRLRDLGYALGQVYNAGRLTGDEARQLRNNFLGAEQVLRSLPRYADMTGLELKKAMEQGRISSADFFEAFFVYTSKFGDAAFKQQQTLLGLKDTLQDVFQLGLGAANLELARFTAALSPLENLKAPLRELLGIFDSLDFTPLIASLGALLNSVLAPITAWVRANREGIINFFQVSLPKGILVTVNIIRAMWAVWSVVFRSIGLVIGAIGQIFGAFAEVIVGGSAGSSNALVMIGRAALIMAAPFVMAMATVAAAINAVIALVMALYQLLSGNVDGAIRTAGTGILRSAEIFASGAAMIVDSWNALDSLENIEWDKLIPDTSDLVNEANRMAGLDPGAGAVDAAFPGGGGGDSGSGGGSAAADRAAQEMNRAMGVLYDLTRRWFGLRSELEKGLLGDEGFEATASSIANMGQRLVEALQQIEGAGNAASFVARGTEKLIALAKKREEAAAALKDAERSLEEAIKARDSFADKVRETSLKFANSFKTEEETVRSFQKFSERGFFYETEEKKQKSFLDSLRERFVAMKAFFLNIKKLRNLGLDEGLLEEMIAAGPEQAGEVAAQLAAGGQAMVDEVNVLQAGVTRVADDLADFGADAFYQAGVDMAQAQVDGITADLAVIEAAAQELGETIFDVVEPWAKEMEDVGRAGGAGLAEGVESGAGAIGDILAGVNTNVATDLGSIRSAFGELPGGIGAALAGGAGPMETMVNDFFGGLYEDIEKWYDEFGESAHNGAANIIGEFIAGWWSQSVWEPIKRWWTDQVLSPLKRWWSGVFTPENRNAAITAIVAFLNAHNVLNAMWARYLQPWWNNNVWHPIQKWWGGLVEKVRNLPKSFITALLNGFNSLVTISLNLPISVNAAGFWQAIVKAVNWVIDKYNSISWLPDLPRLSSSYRGGTFNSGSGATATAAYGAGIIGGYVPQGSISTGGGGYTIQVFIGETELTDIVDTRVAVSSSTSGRLLTQGSRV